MSGTLTFPTRHQPFRMQSGALALAVHAAFFSLLYFGFNWRSEAPHGMTAEIWSNLPVTPTTTRQQPPAPETKPEPPPPPPKSVPKTVEPPAPPKPAPTPAKAEIELKDKKKTVKPEPEPTPAKPEKSVKEPPKPATEPAKPAPPKISEAIQREQAQLAEMERQRAAQAAAGDKLVNEYVARISSKIRHNIVMPPDVPDTARAEFDVTLLPGGSVLDARLTKSSGNPAYDAAVERAILKSQPLPLPPDATLFNRFRQLHLVFTPTDR